MQQCVTCKKIKPLDNFHFKNRILQKKQGYCKACKREKDAKRYSSMTAAVYAIECTPSQTVYIGYASKYPSRRSDHATRLKRNIHPNRHLQRDYNKYGCDAIRFKIIKRFRPGTSRDTLRDEETKTIRLMMESNQNLYNRRLPLIKKSDTITTKRKEDYMGNNMEDNRYVTWTLGELKEYVRRNNISSEFSVKVDAKALLSQTKPQIKQQINVNNTTTMEQKPKSFVRGANTTLVSGFALSKIVDAGIETLNKKCSLDGVNKDPKTGMFIIDLNSNWVRTGKLKEEDFVNPEKKFYKTAEAYNVLGIGGKPHFRTVESLGVSSIAVSPRNRRFLISDVDSVKKNDTEATQNPLNFSWDF